MGGIGRVGVGKHRLVGRETLLGWGGLMGGKM